VVTIKRDRRPGWPWISVRAGTLSDLFGRSDLPALGTTRKIIKVLRQDSRRIQARGRIKANSITMPGSMIAQLLTQTLKPVGIALPVKNSNAFGQGS
jgi:hypothetical protein